MRKKPRNLSYEPVPLALLPSVRQTGGLLANSTYGTSWVHERYGMRNSEAAAATATAAAATATAATQMNYPRKDGAEERMDWSPFQMGAFTLLEWSNLALLLE